VTWTDEIERWLEQAEALGLGAVRGEVTRLLAEQQAERMRAEVNGLARLLDSIRRELKEATEDLKGFALEAQKRATMRARERRRLALRCRLSPRRAPHATRSRRRVCQLSNAWMVSHA